MSERRKTDDIDAENDDSGLFGKGIVAITIDLTPLAARSGRRDLVVKGFVGDTEVDVIFPGRRARNTSPLTGMLEMFAVGARRAAAEDGMPIPTADRIRCPVQVEGCWRPRITTDASGWPTRRYQLLAARWTIDTGRGPQVFGDRPAL